MLMLSATQIYTIFTVQLFAFLNLLPVEADITAVSGFMWTDHKSVIRERHLFLWQHWLASKIFLFICSSVVCICTVLGYIVSVVSKNVCFPSFSIHLTTKPKASRTCLRGLVIVFQQRVWRWVKKHLRRVVSLETHISASIGNCSYKALIKKKMSKHMGICCKCDLFCLSRWNSAEFWKQQFFLTTWPPANQKWVWQQHNSVSFSEKHLLKMCLGG